MKKLRVGRKPSLEKDQELTERLCSLLAGGCSVKTACEATGVSESSFYDYLRRADPEHSGHEPRFLEFLQRVTRARGEGKATLIGLVAEAARTDWRAAIALIDRIAPNEYGRVVREEARGSNGERGSNGGLLPPSAPGPIIHVTVQRDEATDRARERFGTCPPERARYRTLPEDPVEALPS